MKLYLLIPLDCRLQITPTIPLATNYLRPLAHLVSIVILSSFTSTSFSFTALYVERALLTCFSSSIQNLPRVRYLAVLRHAISCKYADDYRRTDEWNKFYLIRLSVVEPRELNY